MSSTYKGRTTDEWCSKECRAEEHSQCSNDDFLCACACHGGMNPQPFTVLHDWRRHYLDEPPVEKAKRRER